MAYNIRIPSIPVITSFYGAVVIIDWIILRFSIYSIRKKEKSLSNPQPHAGDEMGRLGYGADPLISPQQPSKPSHDQASLLQRDKVGSSSSASGMHVTGEIDPSDTVVDPHAGAAHPDQPHKPIPRGS